MNALISITGKDASKCINRTLLHQLADSRLKNEPSIVVKRDGDEDVLLAELDSCSDFAAVISLVAQIVDGDACRQQELFLTVGVFGEEGDFITSLIVNNSLCERLAMLGLTLEISFYR